MTRIDYVELVDGDKEPVARWTPVLLAAAAWVGDTRLIDKSSSQRRPQGGASCC
jgi:pantothenate synthetase